MSLMAMATRKQETMVQCPFCEEFKADTGICWICNGKHKLPQGRAYSILLDEYRQFLRNNAFLVKQRDEYAQSHADSQRLIHEIIAIVHHSSIDDLLEDGDIYEMTKTLKDDITSIVSDAEKVRAVRRPPRVHPRVEIVQPVEAHYQPVEVRQDPAPLNVANEWWAGAVERAREIVERERAEQAIAQVEAIQGN